MVDPVLLDSAILLAGIVLLYLGAEVLVSTASALALGHGVKAATVGVTIVAFATTAPELFVSTIGGLTASDSIALGNIVGSNVANIGLVLGVSAMISPLEVDEDALYQHGPFMLLAAVALVGLGLDGSIGAFDGAAMLALLAVFTGYLLYRTRTSGEVAMPEDVDVESEDVTAGPRDYAMLLGSIVLLLVGSRALITGGRGILTAWGFSDLVIGLTIIAFGTSVPELATSVVGAVRGEAEFSVGNVIGSNIYNVLAVIGFVSIIVPITVQSSTIQYEFPVMLGFTVAALALMAVGERITRVQGALLVAAYGGFLYFLVP